MSETGNTVSDQVAAILTAAEQTADQLRGEAEERLRARIAEADRAAENRVKAAEDEAGEIVRAALKTRSDADVYARELMGDARQISSDVRAGGTELTITSASSATRCAPTPSACSATFRPCTRPTWVRSTRWTRRALA